MVLNRHIYKGPYIQRGSGIGSILSSLFKAAVPVLSGGAKALVRNPAVRRAARQAGNEMLATGTKALRNAAKGQSMKTGLKEDLNAAKQRIASAALNPSKKALPPCAKRPRRARVKKQGKLLHRRKEASTKRNIFNY